MPSCPRISSRHVVGKLRAEVHADALRPDQAHDLLDPLPQRRRRIVKQQVRFIEHERKLRLVEIADLRQLLEQLGQQPEQERRIEARLEDQLIRGEDVDDAAAGEIGAEQIGEFERRLAEELLAAVTLDAQQARAGSRQPTAR